MSLVTDPIGRKVKSVYDAAGQVVQVIKAYGSPLQQTYATTTYSPNGQALTVTDARGQVTKTVYDGFDRSIKLLYPDATPANDNDNLFEAFTYDAGSRKLTETRRGGQVLTYAYDDLDRVTSRSGGGMPTRTFTYDVGGRGLSVKDMNGAAVVAETQYTYDTAGRLTRERRNDWNLNVDYQLDASGNRTRITWPDAFYAAYVYDGAGRVISVATPTLTLRSYAYDHFSRRTGQTVTPGASQTVTTYGYEIDSDLSSLTHNYPGATLDLAFTHTTSAAGQLLSTITSEPLNRYTPGTTLGTQTYAAANPLNQYPSVTPIGGSATTLTYDLNGNLTGDGSSTYTYDATNRLLSIAGLVTASYGYDALDRRMQKTAAATTTRYLHAGSDEIAEYSSAGALLRRYVPAPGTDERAAMIDSGLASPPATSIKYAHTDRQGSVMAVTDSTGAVSERFAYDGFGRSSSALSGYPFRYTGQRLDFESGLMFYKARVYSTSLGRFLQTDPIGTKDDLNLYAYVGNDPVNKTDPDGREWYYDEDNGQWEYQSELALQLSVPGQTAFDNLLTDSYNGRYAAAAASAVTWLGEDILFAVTLGDSQAARAPIIAARAAEVGASSSRALVPRAAKTLGDWGEARLASYLEGAGTRPLKPFLTSRGPRLPDYMVGRIAHESKAGLNVKMTDRLRRQMVKDKELIDKGRIDGAVWHFWQGVDSSVTNALDRYGIDYVVH